MNKDEAAEVVNKLRAGGFDKDKLLRLAEDIRNLRGTGEHAVSPERLKEKYKNVLDIASVDVTDARFARLIVAAISANLKSRGEYKG